MCIRDRSWGVQTLRPYESLKKTYTKSQIRALLSARFSSYCEDLEKKGVEIIENDVKIYTGSKEARAQGTLTVLTVSYTHLDVYKRQV